MRPFHNPSERGFSMVELMVAMLIGLIGMIIIFQVFEVSEGIKRSTTSGGDAQQNGAVALYVMEHDLRNAGMGFNDAPFAGCNILAFDSQRATQNFTMALVPALITPGGAATVPDQLTVFYGSKPLIANATMLASNWLAATDPLNLMNTYAYRPGDLLVLLEPASGKNCSLMEATYVGSVATLDSGTVRHADSGSSYLLASGSNVTARFNRAGGLGVLYGGAVTANVTRVFNMGNLYEPAGTPTIPVSNTYAIDASHNLAVSSAFVIDPATNKAPRVSPVADNIVHMRVQYGLDDGIGDGSVTFAGTFVAGDGLVDRFVPAATFNAIVPAPWQSLIALRVAIVARSAQPERPLGSDGTNCDATTDGTESTPGPDRRPRWSGSGIAGGALDVSASGDPSATSPAYWKCYRYRVFETIIPLRNWIWRSS